MIFITAVFALGLRSLEVKTIFSDLFPKTHPFVQAYKDHPNFGNPLTVTMMVKRTDGKDIYTAETMEKVWQMSRDIDLVPGVDHDQIVSVATGKARYTVLTADGIYSNPIMDEKAPTTPEELAEVRRRVNESPVVRSFLVSQDGTAAIINATFIERLVDYGVVFDGVQEMIKKYEDGQHKVYVAGWPTLTGWAYHFGADTIKIFAVTLSLMFIFLLIAMRNTAGVLTPVLVSTFSTIWGFGFVGWIHDPVEPLLMVVPLLLIARCFSHSVQATERYYELLAEIGDKRKAAEMSLAVMVAPGTLGIFTDVCGLLLVALAPIPALERFAIFTGFWALMLVPTSVIMTPVLLSLLPAPKNVERLVGHSRESGFINKFLNQALTRMALLSTGKNAKVTAGVFVLLTILSLFMLTRLQVGNPVEGSNLLRYDSEFNTAVRAINQSFPGVMTLEVIFEGKKGRIVRQSDALTTMRTLQRCLESQARPPTATLSFADYAPEANRLFNGGNPKWSPLDRDDKSVSAASSALMLGTSPVAFLHIADFEQKNATVSLWYANNKQDTVDAALSDARKCIDQVGIEHENFRIRLASGSIALQQSINDTVDKYQWYIMAGINLVIAIGCTLVYRSFAAALILLVPVNLANFMLTAFMVLMGMGLDVNSLPILAIGIGVGIDYGIYMLSRLCEEYKDTQHMGDAIKLSLVTCGKAILFTALLMTIGIVPWYFLSELKFLSDMGLLLVVVMTINMFLALILVPLLVYLFKPKFVSSEHQLLSESVDGLLDAPAHEVANKLDA
ncbi:MAG: MMPL family transporter [Betaproteobacteria bacterium]|nr:MMPL family transporter [Betaproteobacteria bacterium]